MAHSPRPSSPTPHLSSRSAAPPVRLLVHGAAPGVWNMALDEALLLSAAERQEMTLRFYQWETATLSLGYFQAHTNRQAHRASQDCPLVRRQTGGGAIVHDRELTYSLSVPPDHPLAGDTQMLYDHWHASLIAVLRAAGVAAERCAEPSGLAKADEPFLCFQRRAVGDVLLGPAKITGSAQRRSQGAVLQHGSILLETSPAAPELPGIAELSGVSLAPAELMAQWAESLSRRLGLQFVSDEVSPAEVELAARLAEEKYGHPHWTERR